MPDFYRAILQIPKSWLNLPHPATSGAIDVPDRSDATVTAHLLTSLQIVLCELLRPDPHIQMLYLQNAGMHILKRFIHIEDTSMIFPLN